MIRWWGGCLLREMCDELSIDLKPGIDRIATVTQIRAYFAPELAYLTALPTILDGNFDKAMNLLN